MRLFILSIILIFLVTGCSLIDVSEKEKEQTKPTTVQSDPALDHDDEKNQSNTQADENDTKPPQSAKSEEPFPKPKEKQLLKFKQIGANYYNVPARPSAGVNYYTKEAHIGSVNRYANWDREDLIYIQFSDPEYYGHIFSIRSMELIDSKTVKIVVRPRKERMFQYDQPARIIFTIPKGSLNPDVQFQIETEGGAENLEY